MFLIWSVEHQAWWRPAERGYTKRIEEAGVYSRQDAKRIVARANVKDFNECAIPFDCTWPSESPS